MPFSAKVYRILVGGPGDTTDERDAAIRAIHAWNHDHADATRQVLLPGLWEADTRPQHGHHPQTAIDRQLVDRSDAMIAIFRERLGTQTQQFPSGTVEELEVIHSGGKEVMVYFYEGPIAQSTAEDESFVSLRKFKQELKSKTYYFGFQNPQNFESLISSHLEKLVHHLTTSEIASAPIATEPDAMSDEDDADSTKTLDTNTEHAWWTILQATKQITPEVLSEAQKAFEQEQISLDDVHKRVSNEAYYQFVRLHKGDLLGLERLEEMLSEFASDPLLQVEVCQALTLAYTHLGSSTIAQQYGQMALDIAVEEKQRTRALTQLAWAQHSIQRKTETYATLVEEAQSLTNRKNVATVYQTLANLCESDNENVLQLLALELAVENTPEDTSIQFAAALASDHLGIDYLTIRHYEALLRANPLYAGALNNLAVALDAHAFPILAADHYHKAHDLKLAIASANLAHRYIDAGFVVDASEYIEAARRNGTESRTAAAEVRIPKEREEEENRREQLLKTSRGLREFLLDCARAAFHQERTQLSGEWRSEDGLLVKISEAGETFQAEWTRHNRVYKLTGRSHHNAVINIKIDCKSESSYIMDTQVEGTVAFYDPSTGHLRILVEKSDEPAYWTLWRDNDNGKG